MDGKIMADVTQWLRLFREGMVRAIDNSRAAESRLFSESPLSSGMEGMDGGREHSRTEEEWAVIDARNKKYLQLLQEESHACRVYYALQSQGKHCPKDKLDEAKRYMRLTEKLTRNYIEFMKIEAEKRIQKHVDRYDGSA